MKDLPVRKHPRLKDYDYSQNGAYFITFCVKGRHEMLGRVVGRDAHIAPPQVELSEYGVIAAKYIEAISDSYQDIYVNKYIIMPNHVHMIVLLESGAMWASRPTKETVSTVVRTLKTLVTKEIGFSLWQTSYYALRN